MATRSVARSRHLVGATVSCVDGSDNRLGKFLFQIIEATRGGMPTRDGNISHFGSMPKGNVIKSTSGIVVYPCGSRLKPLGLRRGLLVPIGNHG